MRAWRASGSTVDMTRPHHTARYAPPARHLGVGLDVLAGHHRQQRRRLGLLLCELRAVERVEHPLGVPDHHEPRPLVGVVPVTHRPGPSVVVMAQAAAGARRRTRRICALIIVTVSWVATASNSTVDQRPHRLVRQRPALSGHLAHRVEDPLRAPAGAQPLAPQRQHARIEAPVVDAQPPAFQRTSQRSRSSSRSEHPSSACEPSPPRSPTPAPTAAPAARRDPRGNNLRRFSAKNRCTDPSRTPTSPRCPTVPGFSVPCIPHDPTPHTRSRAPRLLKTLLELNS